jgi:hypothetical protein
VTASQVILKASIHVLDVCSGDSHLNWECKSRVDELGVAVAQANL